MLTNDYQERNKVIRLSYLFKLLDGLSTGLYLLIYTSIIGHISFHHQQILNPLSFGALYVLLLFVQEYFLEIWGGAVGDKFGSLTAIKGGITCRIAFFILLATMVLFKESNIVFYITLLLSSLSFSLSFTLFSGNIEKFLFSGIKMEPLKENNFFRQDSISDFIRGLGILFGAIFSYYILILNYEKIELDNYIYLHKYHSLPFAIGAFILFTMLLYLFFRNEKKTVNQKIVDEGRSKKINEEDLAKKIRNAKLTIHAAENSQFKRIYIMNALLYTCFQMVSIFIPIWIMMNDFETLQKNTILYPFAFFLPSAIGSFFSFDQRKNGYSKDQIYSIQLKKSENLFLVIGASLIVMVFACGMKNFYMYLLMIIINRFLYMVAKQKLKFITADWANTYHIDFSSSLVSILYKWEKLIVIGFLVFSVLINNYYDNQTAPSIFKTNSFLIGIALIGVLCMLFPILYRSNGNWPEYIKDNAQKISL